MKKEEKLLNALTDVNSSYIYECSQYLGNEQKDVVFLKPQKTRWTHFAALAACMLLFLAATLVFFPATRQQQAKEQETESTTFSMELYPADDKELKILGTEAKTGNFASITQIQVSLTMDGEVVQIITPDILPSGYGSGLFFNYAAHALGNKEAGQLDVRDLNFDGCTDLGIPTVNAMADNIPYCYLLWNADKQEYEYGFVLYGGASSLEVDEENQTLTETIVRSDGTSKQTYRYEDGVLKIVKSSVLESTGDEITSDSQPSYQITYDETQFGMTTGADGDCISPLKGVGSYQPTCEIQIEYLTGVLPCTAVAQTEVALGDVDVAEKTTNWNRTVLHVEYGDEWDSTVEDIYYVAAGIRGTYRLTARYYLEAEDYRELFTEICESFVCPLNESPNAEAERTVAAFVDAYFSSNLSAMSQYASEELSESDAYNLSYTALQLVSLDGLETVDEQIAKNGSAELDLSHLTSAADETYTHLRMAISKDGDEYKISKLGSYQVDGDLADMG